jgi:hypothetical protein
MKGGGRPPLCWAHSSVPGGIHHLSTKTEHQNNVLSTCTPPTALPACVHGAAIATYAFTVSVPAAPAPPSLPVLPTEADRPALLLAGLVQDALLQQAPPVVDLDDVPVRRQLPGPAHGDVLLPGVLGEAPLEALEDLLPAGELELAPPDGLDDVGLVAVLAPHREQDLADADSGGNADGLPVRVAHPAGQPVGAGAAQHLVGAEDVEGVGPHPDVVGVLPNVLGQVLVDGDAAGLQRLRADLLLLVADHVGNEGEQVDGGLLGPHVVDADLRLGHTAAVPGLDVRLVLLVAVATGWTATHGDVYCGGGSSAAAFRY